MTELEEGTIIDTTKYIDPEVVLHPVISKWRNSLTIDIGLMNSLKQGQIQPIIFRLKNGKHELIVGARRYFHQKLLGTSWKDIPKEIKEDVSDRDAMLMAASENLFRQDFNPWEQARVISDLITEGGMKIKDVAKHLNVSEEVVRSRRALLELPEKLRKIFEEHNIPIGFAVPVKKLKKYPEGQERLLENIMEGMESRYGGTDTIEKAEEFVNRIIKQVKDMETLVAKYGVCPKCESNKIKESDWQGKEDKLQCTNCGHSWHKETKEPWEYYEMKQKAKEMGFEVEEGPETVKFTPKQVAKMIEEEQEKASEEKEEKEEDKWPEKFRSNIPLETIVAPLINENIQKITVKGSSIDIELIEDKELYFKGLKKDYKAGEKARIEVLTAWTMNTQETAEKIHGLIKRLSG